MYETLKELVILSCFVQCQSNKKSIETTHCLAVCVGVTSFVLGQAANKDK